MLGALIGGAAQAVWFVAVKKPNAIGELTPTANKNKESNALFLRQGLKCFYLPTNPVNATRSVRPTAAQDVGRDVDFGNMALDP